MRNFLLIISACLLFLNACNSSKNYIDKVDFETRNESGSHFLSSLGIETKGGFLTDTSTSFEGKSSVRINAKKAFAGKYSILDVQPGQYLKISIWRKSKGNESLLCLAETTPKHFYTESNIVAEEKNGWKKIVLETVIPFGLIENNLNFYLWCKDGIPANFDNLEIQLLDQYPKDKIPSQEALHVNIDEKNFKHIESVRSRAMEAGVLKSRKGDYVNGTIQDDEALKTATLRLKGDWIDHFQSKKWSYRIKLDSLKWKGLKKFSIQNPKTRNFLHEWLIHQLYDQEGLLTTTYDFTPLFFNDVYYGVFAYEEHFEKELLKKRGRKNGPIFKWYEDDLFEHYRMEKKDKTKFHPPMIESAEILAYHQKKYLKDSTKQALFYLGQKLMYQLQWGQGNIDSIIDVEQCAKAYALNALTQTYHGLHWHNQRFYLNPETKLLEWINYDADNGWGTSNNYISGAFFGSFFPSKKNIKHNLVSYHGELFKSDKFMGHYIFYLKKYSSEAFIDQFIEDKKEAFNERLQLLQTDFPNYNIDIQLLKENAAKVRDKLNGFVWEVKKPEYKENINSYYFFKEHEEYPHPYPQFFFKVHQEDASNICILSYWDLPSKLIGFSNTKDKIEMEHSMNIGAYVKNEPPKRTIISIDQKWKYLVFEVNQVQYFIKVMNWKAPSFH